VALNPNLSSAPSAAQTQPEPGTVEWLAFLDLLKSGNRAALGRALTWMESTRQEDRIRATALLETLPEPKEPSFRLGVSGIPGVGKSTWTEAYGVLLLREQSDAKLAVLAVDPSSSVRGGSLLGDKTRMEQLSLHPRAFVRPSPAGTSLGGVTWGTRDSITLCERLGYTHILVETVGVGQSETAVHDLVDCLLLLLMPASGDGLQGMKKGIMEVADVVAVQKADGALLSAAQQAAVDARAALRFTASAESHWVVPVQTVSALTGAGMEDLLATLDRFFRHAHASGRWAQRRTGQRKKAFWEGLEHAAWDLLRSHPDHAAHWNALAQSVVENQTNPRRAVEEALRAAGLSSGLG
jgi:LAO/AO transport system kinase